MISFEPLRKYMKANGITEADLAQKMGLNSNYLPKIFNSQTIPGTDFLEKVCIALNLGIDDVISFREGETVVSGFVKVNYQKLSSLLSEKGMSLTAASRAINKPYWILTEKKKENTMFILNDLISYCEIWGISYKEVLDEVQ